MDQIKRTMGALRAQISESDLGILDLPDTVVLKIFANLSHPELCKIALVCRHWLWIVYDSELWKHLDLQNFHCIDESNIINLIQTRLSPLLRTLNLSNSCRITPLLINQLTDNCRQLATLSLQGCKWDILNQQSDTCVMEMSVPKNLQRLDLRDFGDRGSFMHLMFQAPNMDKLECFGFGNKESCKSCPTFLDFHSLFKKMSNLKVLECCDSEIITDETLEIISEELPVLSSLNVKSCRKIVGTSLRKLVWTLRHLKCLILTGTSIHDDSLASVAWERCLLEDLDLSMCDRITTNGLQAVVPKLPHLLHLCLNNCGRGKAITNALFVDVGGRFLWPNIQTLSLQFCCRLTSEGLSYLRNCVNLENLSLRSCHRVAFSELSTILPFFKKLKAFECGSLFASPEASRSWDNLLTSIPQNCPHLEKLILLKCTGITIGNMSRYRPRILEFLLNCKSLTNVCLQHCDAGIENLFLECSRNLKNRRKVAITTGALSNPVIPQHRYSFDLYMKEKGPLS